MIKNGQGGQIVCTYDKDCSQCRPGTNQKLFSYESKSERLPIAKPKAEANSKPQDYRGTPCAHQYNRNPIQILLAHEQIHGHSLRLALTSGRYHKKKKKKTPATNGRETLFTPTSNINANAKPLPKKKSSVYDQNPVETAYSGQN